MMNLNLDWGSVVNVEMSNIYVILVMMRTFFLFFFLQNVFSGRNNN